MTDFLSYNLDSDGQVFRSFIWLHQIQASLSLICNLIPDDDAATREPHSKHIRTFESAFHLSVDKVASFPTEDVFVSRFLRP